MVFLRRTSHVVSIIALCAPLLVSVFARAASPEPQPSRSGAVPKALPKEPSQPYNDEQIRKSIDAIAAELKAIREEQAQAEAHAANRQSTPGPPNYSNWALVMLAGIAALFAAKTFTQTRRQANAAAQQVIAATSPRLYVEGVTAANFKPGTEAVFFLKIANAGPVQAENVKVFVEIKHRSGGTRPTGDGNAILIPANGHQLYDFRSSFILPFNLLELDDWNLTVSGTITYNGNTQSYCYKYNQWGGPRPSGVPLFVPCDYDARRNISIALTGVSGIAIAGKLSAVTEFKKAETPKPET